MAYLHYCHKLTDHIPGPPRSSFIFGHTTDVWNYRSTTGKTTFEFLLEKRLEYGPVFALNFLHKSMVLIGDPGMVRHVFIDNQKNLCKNDYVTLKLGFIYGERGLGSGLLSNVDEASWQKRRRIMNPAFYRKCLKDYLGNFNNVCDRFLVRMNTVVDDGKPVSMVSEFGK